MYSSTTQLLSIILLCFSMLNLLPAQDRGKIDIWYEEVGDFIKVYGKNDSKEDTTGHLFFPLDPNGNRDQYMEVFIPRKTEKRLLTTFNIRNNPNGTINNFYYKFWITGEETYIEWQDSYYFDQLYPKVKEKNISKEALISYIIEGFELYKDKEAEDGFKLLEKQYPRIDSTYAILIANLGIDPFIIPFKFLKNNLKRLLNVSKDKEDVLDIFINRAFMDQQGGKIKPDKVLEMVQEHTQLSIVDSMVTSVALLYDLDEKWTKGISIEYIQNYTYNEKNHEGLMIQFKRSIIEYHNDLLTQKIFNYLDKIDLTKINPKNATDILSLQIYALHNLGEKARAQQINQSTALFAQSKNVPYDITLYPMLVKAKKLKK
jgi:hypothetical protein